MFTKPFVLHDIKAKIDELLDRRRAMSPAAAIAPPSGVPAERLETVREEVRRDATPRPRPATPAPLPDELAVAG